jgi:membrane-associated phospholipid phosphatase
MKKAITIYFVFLFVAVQLQAQPEPAAGTWKPWLISSVKDWRLPPPASYKAEIAQVLTAQSHLDSAGLQQILYWNAGAPGYRWHEMMSKLWTVDTSNKGALANMLLGVAIYDATIAAWDAKYTYQRPRPFVADKRIRLLAVRPESPSFPCENSVAAGVAVAVFSHFYPHLADSVNRMAQRAMASRIAAGVAFPNDTKAGFELGKKIAEKEIAQTREYIATAQWDGKMPEGSGYWRRKKPMYPMGGRNKTILLENGSQFRPAPPPDFAKDMAELKGYKQTFMSKANAFYYASQNFGDNMLHRKLFEYNLSLNPPRAARVYAATAVASYDCFIACWDAKYAYWGIRPDQYDTTYKPLLPTPPFPGYPSGHAVMSGMMEELYSYFFPADKAYFSKVAKDGAESRFQGGIHFRTDNEVGLDLGRKVAAVVVQRLKADGADGNPLLARPASTLPEPKKIFAANLPRK